jgi:hypothetical protein
MVSEYRNMAKVTQKQKILIYEKFFDKINVFCTSGENSGISELIKNADRFSYALRQNTSEENTSKEQLRFLEWTFKTLCNTPETDSKLRKRQRAFEKNQKLKKNSKIA